MRIIVLVLCICIMVSCQNPKSCITDAFNSTCKSQLYSCFNNSDCSYQLHTNTLHIFLRDEDTTVPPIYFSNPLAIALHECLNTKCKIGELDKAYPATLPTDYCIMEVWDICGGDVEEVYAGKAGTSVLACYKGLCPNFKDKLDRIASI